MRALFAVALLGCGASAPVTTPIAPAIPAVTPQELRVAVRTGLVGHVTLDGRPVSFFGVATTHNFASGQFGVPVAFFAIDGRFELAAQAGTWDLIVAGPGFARRIVVGVNVLSNQLTDLGEVKVEHGHSIHGTVRDDGGLPVSGARVSLVEQPHAGVEDDLAARTRGNLTATTDRDGRYLVEGYVPLPLSTTHTQIAAASGDHRVSVPEPVPDADATIDFTIAHGGTLDVTIDGGADHLVIVSPAGKRGVLMTGHSVDASEVFEGLPAGDYDVVLFIPEKPASSQRHRVSVAAGSVTSIALTTPTLAAVAVTIHVKGGCQSVHLGAPRLQPVTATCHGEDAQFDAVVPGMYLACTPPGGSCAALHISDDPATQRFEFPRP